MRRSKIIVRIAEDFCSGDYKVAARFQKREESGICESGGQGPGMLKKHARIPVLRQGVLGRV